MRSSTKNRISGYISDWKYCVYDTDEVVTDKQNQLISQLIHIMLLANQRGDYNMVDSIEKALLFLPGEPVLGIMAAKDRGLPEEFCVLTARVFDVRMPY